MTRTVTQERLQSAMRREPNKFTIAAYINSMTPLEIEQNTDIIQGLLDEGCRPDHIVKLYTDG